MCNSSGNKAPPSSGSDNEAQSVNNYKYPVTDEEAEAQDGLEEECQDDGEESPPNPYGTTHSHPHPQHLAGLKELNSRENLHNLVGSHYHLHQGI